MRRRWIFGAACLGLLSIAVVGGLARAQQAKLKERPRQVLPDAAAEEKALAAMRGLYGADYDKAKTPEQKAAVATKLLAAAKRARRGSADLFVLAKLARDIAVQAGSPDLTIQAVDLLAEQFEVDGPQMKAELLPKVAKTARQPADKKALVLAGIAASEQAVARDDYPTADKMLELASAAARDLRDPTLAGQLAARRDAVVELGRMYSVVAKARAVLDEKPGDPSANLAVGTFYCLWKGDWESGLPMLASSGDATLRRLAEQELDVGGSAQSQLALADAWWDLSAKSDGISRKQLQLHAASWYKQALAGLPEGLAKSKAEKRLSDTEGLASGLPVATKSPGAGGSGGPDGKSEAGRKGRLVRKGRYESMLGLYLSDNKPIPYVNLAVPGGSNLLSEDVAAMLRGRVDFGHLNYAGMARFEVLKDGNYEIDQHFQQVLIDRRDMGFGTAKGTVHLTRGVHEIRVHEVGPRIRAAYIKVRNKQTGEAVPLFNFGGDVEKFLRQSIGPWKVSEVSGWEPKELAAGQ